MKKVLVVSWFLHYSLGMSSSSTLRPFHVRLFSDIFVEFAELFIHAVDEKQASKKAVAAMQDDMEDGEWVVVQIACTENM